MFTYVSDQDFEKLFQIKAKVTKVHVEGVNKTKDELLVKMVSSLIRKVHTLKGLLEESQSVKNKLQSLGIFSDIKLSVDTDPDDNSGYELTYSVEEKNVSGTVETLLEKNATSIVLASALPNVGGRGAKLIGEYHIGTKRTSKVNCSLQIPLMPWTEKNPTFITTIFNGSNDKAYSAFRETDRGFLTGLSFQSTPFLFHNLKWSGKWREIGPLGNRTPFQIREEFGHSLKSSVSHTMRFLKPHPQGGGGYSLRFKQEYAGSGGNVQFHRHEIWLESLILRYKDLALHGFLGSGILKGDFIPIADRYFIGGPSSIRGFEEDGVGPHSESGALGANCFWVGGLHLDTPLPFIGTSRFADFFKFHMFANAGNIGKFDFNGDIFRYLNSLANRYRLSCGFGLVFHFNRNIRFEFNYCIPMLFQPGDRPAPGLQFGAGINYADPM